MICHEVFVPRFQAAMPGPYHYGKGHLNLQEVQAMVYQFSIDPAQTS